ncbi:MAG TPA: membrane protein insertase YidC [Flavipsychrobacter sp.]|nr:membrane protein insertase YidC [Flavipsychrobacter sp.]
MDRNSVIGFGLLIVLLIGYVMYNQHEQKVYQAQKMSDSVAYAKVHPKPLVDSSKAAKQVAVADSLNDSLRRSMPPAYSGKAQNVTLENKKLALQFTSKGAFPVSAQIKGFKTYYQKPLYIFNGKGNMLNAILPINNGAVATADLYFAPVIKDMPNGDKIADFTADLGSGKKIEIMYTLPADDYMMQCSIHLTGLPTNSLPLSWEMQGLHTEKDVTLERMSTQVYYKYENQDHDYFTVRDQPKKLSESVQWLGLRKQYFSNILVSKDAGGFTDVNVNANTKFDEKDTAVAVSSRTTMDVALKANNDETVAFSWYIGPNDYKVLKSYKMNFDDMVPMGYGVMSFVKYINRWALIPLFYFFGSFIGSYVVIIVLMTLLIRLILSFFTYKSYLSAAKMRVLKPELDELRAKYKDDQQKFGMEQMKLYRSVGVSPLGGCLPTLFQMPILFAMYYMFPSFIEFRQQHFLWASDLSTYDSIAKLPFNIPFYGDHVSLFTLLMTATSLFLALSNRNMTTQDPNMKAMKYMPYIFPFVLIGVFNKMAAALTFYYTLSNIMSITQQFVIQKYFINEQAIHAQMQENKNKPATPSKWAKKLEEVQKAQQQRVKVQPRINKK